MHSEVLIYGYGLVCLSMLAFNVVYSIYLRADQVRISRRTVALEEEMERQLARISEGGEVDGSHIRSLCIISAASAICWPSMRCSQSARRSRR